MSTPEGEAEIAALAKDAGVSHETARHALLMDLLYARVFRARDTFFLEHGRTPETEAAWAHSLLCVLGGTA